MKKEIHPQNYRPVVFEDISNGERFLIDSAVETGETTKFDGKEYPLFKVEVTSASHPFYTGTDKRLDTAGRAEKFRTRASKAKK